MSIPNDPTDVPDVPTDIEVVESDADPVTYYRPGEVIAVGEVARSWVINESGSDTDTAPSVLRRGDDATSTVFLLAVSGNPVAVVDAGQAAGHHVQLNHVFFAHADPCCVKNTTNFPPALTPYRASPYRASSPNKTTAVKADTGNLTDRVGDPLPQNERPNVKVWIIDTGISKSTEPTPLSGLIGAGLINGDATDQPDEIPPPGVDPVAGHGTFIAGIIEQLTPGCDIWISDVIKPRGDLSESDVVKAIDALLVANHSTDLSRTILNLSFGGGLYTNDTNAVKQAIEDAQEVGVVVVASAGNEESCQPFYPAYFPGVVAVAALDSHGQAAAFTNRGGWVDACALGVDIVSTFFRTPPPPEPNPDFEGWAVWSGTSFAAPVVVAAIANEMAGDPSMSAVTARDHLLEGTRHDCLGVPVGVGTFSDPLKAENP